MSNLTTNSFLWSYDQWTSLYCDGCMYFSALSTSHCLRHFVTLSLWDRFSLLHLHKKMQQSTKIFMSLVVNMINPLQTIEWTLRWWIYQSKCLIIWMDIICQCQEMKYGFSFSHFPNSKLTIIGSVLIWLLWFWNRHEKKYLKSILKWKPNGFMSEQQIRMCMKFIFQISKMLCHFPMLMPWSHQSKHLRILCVHRLNISLK